MTKKICILFALCTLLFSCTKYNESGLFPGSNVTVYNGIANSWFTTDNIGIPNQLAISMDDALFNSLPSGANASEASFIINLDPIVSRLTPFNHIELDWNPNGHPPAGVYDLPHFDFHFYMITDAEVQLAYDSAKLESVPPADYLPVNYVNGPSVPKMGKHWIDVTSGEFPPKPGNSSFTQTFLYGSYDGKITFYEPMITKSFLESNTYFERQIPQPAKFQRSGYFPTRMITRKTNNKTEVILDKFVWRQAS